MLDLLTAPHKDYHLIKTEDPSRNMSPTALLLESGGSRGNLAHFPSLREVNLVQQKLSEYATLVSNLDLEFEMRFQDFRKNSGDMELFSQPFSTRGPQSIQN
uniref:general transcription factor II-I repeat domain-containing protein 2-like n=1 Tax=Monopterus albus TaxID=43700 RepID=UPI0009B3C01B|nr:general transcription factor II-I repeat domain-containing protein 2-like [Monopterus albus]